MKINTPKLRFKEFADEWLCKKLGDVGENIIGLTYSPSNVTPDTDYPIVLRSSNIKNGVLLFDDLVRVKEKIPEKLFVKLGDILICTRNGSQRLIGKNTIITKLMAPTTFGAFMSVYRSKNNNFIKHLFETANYKKQIQMNLGARINQITTGYLNAFKFYFPTADEQEKIAGFLTAVDEKINHLEERKKGFEKYKKGVMQAIFNQKIRFKPDLPSEASAKLGGSNYPDWEEKKLGDLGKFVSGQGFTDVEQGGKTGVPFYKVSDMNTAGNEDTMNTANHYVTVEQIKRMKYRPIKENSIIFAKVGAAIFLERKRLAQNFILDNNMMAFVPKVSIKFMRFVFQRTQLSRFAQVGALPSYNASDLAIIKVEIPTSKDEQEKIAGFLTSLDSRVELINKELEQAKLFKKSLLQQMFV